MERYEKIRVIGQGAFGKVFLLRRIFDKTNVVIKQIPVDELLAEERRSAMNEVSVLKMLKHPNIVAYYDSFVEDKSLMIAMEYAPGGTLYEFILERNKKLLEEEHILQLFVQILVAIQHVHSLNILHRDLKPQNIMLNKKRSVVKIGDFGISKVLSTKITSAQTVVGTPCYISPEICEGRVYRKKSDIWALGCILYELTTLHKAFEAQNLPALVLKIMQAAEGITPINTKYSRGLQKLVYSLLQRNPDDRPNIENTMANPVIVNALVNLGTDVGRLPCNRPTGASNNRPVGVRMGALGGSIRQRSFFQEDYEDDHRRINKHQSNTQPKPQVLIWGGGLSVPLQLPQLPEGRINSISLGRTLRQGITAEGKLIAWELSASSLATTGLTISSHTKAKEPILFQPRLIEGQSSVVIKKVACGDLFTACLTDKGILMTFGSGINGCLGHGNYDDVITPKLVEKMLEYETVDVSCGANHVMALVANNTLFSWGKGESGQLGTGDNNSYYTPQQVIVSGDVSIKSIVCGTDCSVIVTNKGNILGCGSNRHNKLGLNPEFSNPHSDPNKEMDLPILALSKKLGDLTQTSIIMSSVFKPSGDDHVTIPTEHVDKSLTFKVSPSRHLQDITAVSLGLNHSAFINVSGKCITSGCNTFGQLGTPMSHDLSPCVVQALIDENIHHVSCGDAFTIACSKGGKIYSWGQNKRGRLGREIDDEIGQPSPIIFEGTCQVQSITSNHSVTMLVAITD